MPRNYQFSNKQRAQIAEHQAAYRSELLQAIIKAACRVNAIPTGHEVAELIKPKTLEVYYHYFPNYRTALSLVNFDLILDPDTRIYRQYDTDESLLAGIRRLARKLGREVQSNDINADRTIPSYTSYSQRFGNSRRINQLAGTSTVLQEMGIIPNAEGYLNDATRTKMQTMVREIGMPLLEHQFDSSSDLPSFRYYVEQGVSVVELNELIGAREILRQRYKYAEHSVVPDIALEPEIIELLQDTVRYTHKRLQAEEIESLAGLFDTASVRKVCGGIDNLNALVGTDQILYEDSQSIYYHLVMPDGLKYVLQEAVLRLGRRLKALDLNQPNLPCRQYVSEKFLAYNQIDSRLTFDMINAGIFADQILAELDGRKL